LNYKGTAFINLKEYLKAIYYFDEALKIDPTYVDANNNKGIAYNNLKEY